MPACVSCGENDFELVDGLYFCTTCQTQTQEIQQIEQDEDVEYGLMRSLVSSNVPHTQEKARKQKDKGRPWTIYEGFQVIIERQVDALIKLGANKELKDIVFRLWAAYLNSSGVAFCKKSELKEPTKYYWQRELFPGTLENPEIKPKKYRKTYYKHFKKSVKTTESKNDTKDLLSQFSKEKFYEEDLPANNGAESSSSDNCSVLDSSSQDDDDDNDDSDDDDFTLPLCKPSSYAEKRQRAKEQMSMLKTISLCYVGLMYTNNLTMPSDVIRWIKEHKVPYLNATSCLPDYMKLYNVDYFTFRAPVPTLKHFRRQVGRWCHFFELETFPPVSMTSLIAKYISMLHLPGELVGITNSLVHHTGATFVYFPSEKLDTAILNFETVAMSFIILTMKMIFGLDDRLERLISDYGRSLQNIKPSESDIFFIFDDWATCLSKEYTCGKYYLSVEDSTVDEVRDVNECLLSLYHDSVQSSKFSETRDKKRKTNQLKTRINLQKPFMELGSSLLMDRDKIFIENVSLEKSSDLSDTQQDDEDTSYGFDDSFSMQQSSDVTGGSADSQCLRKSKLESFSKKSVGYIINPHTVLEDFDNSVLSDYTIYSSLVEDSQDSDSGSDSDNQKCEFSFPALSPQIDSTVLKRKKKLSLTKKVVQKRLKTHVQKPKFDEKKLGEIVNQFIDSQESYSIYSKCRRMEDKSRSFNWLLNIMSSLIYCSVKDLESELNRWEAAHFTDAFTWWKGLRHIFWKFKRQYNLQ